MIFYTYMWLREDGTPYYVGKGKDNRAFIQLNHRFAPPSAERIILQEWPSEQDAFDAETLLIAVYGRKDNGTGILRNLTDGGEGVAGLKCSEEQRIKLRNSLGLKPSAETLDKLRRAKLGGKNPHSTDWSRRHSSAMQKKWADPVFRNRMSKIQSKAQLGNQNRRSS